MIWSRAADVTVTRDDVGVSSVETVDVSDAGRAGGRDDVGGRPVGGASQRRDPGDTDECAGGRDAVRQAARGPRHAVKSPTAARRRLPRTSVRVATGRPAAVHAADRYDRALERSQGCSALQASLSAAVACATWTLPHRPTWTPSC